MLGRRRIQMGLQSCRGFTMVELMIAITIFAIMIALAAPAYRITLENARIRSAAEGISAGFQMARAEAVRRNAPVTLTIGPQGAAWQIDCIAGNLDCPGPTLIKQRSRGEDSTLTIGVTPPAMVATFNSAGMLTGPGAGTGCPGPGPNAIVAAASNICFHVRTTSPNFAAGETRPLAVIVDVGGKIRMCDPSIPTGIGDTRACS